MKIMAGKKQFDENKALDLALVAFWHSGYEATSYVDLEAATGLNKSSLYNAFGAKSSLYQKCLKRFESAHEKALINQLQPFGLRDVLIAYFETLFEHFADSDVPCGSLATMQDLPADSEMEDRSETRLNRLEALLKSRFDRAVREGELPRDADTVALTSLFLVVSRGLAVLHQGKADIKIMRNALVAALVTLDSPPRT